MLQSVASENEWTGGCVGKSRRFQDTMKDTCQRCRDAKLTIRQRTDRKHLFYKHAVKILPAL